MKIVFSEFAHQNYMIVQAETEAEEFQLYVYQQKLTLQGCKHEYGLSDLDKKCQFLKIFLQKK